MTSAEKRSFGNSNSMMEDAEHNYEGFGSGNKVESYRDKIKTLTGGKYVVQDER